MIGGWWYYRQQLPLAKIEKSRYVAAGFVSNDTNFTSWNGRLRVLTSNDGIKWQKLATTYPKMQFRDGSIYKYHHTYFIIYTTGLMKTTDFQHWTRLSWPVSWRKFHSVWAPEFYTTENHRVGVIVSAESRKFSDNQHFKLYTAKFDPKKESVGKQWHKLTGDGLSTSAIDPNLTYYQGKYHLWYANNCVDGNRDSRLELAVSDYPDRGYHKVATNVNRNRLGVQYEAPELERVITNHKKRWVLYQDPYNSDGYRYGITYAVMGKDELHWSNFKKISAKIKVRHFGILAQ